MSAQVKSINMVEYDLPYEFINELRVISKFEKILKVSNNGCNTLYTLPSGYPIIITDENKLVIISPLES